MMKFNKKRIMKSAKEASVNPFDWGVSIEMYVNHLYFMRDYYALGENVWACEIEGMSSRKEMLDEILQEYEKWQNSEDKYVVVLVKSDKDYEEQLKKYLDAGYFLKDDIGKEPLLKGVTFLYKYENFYENIEKCNEEYARHRKNFFELLEKYIEYLWD